MLQGKIKWTVSPEKYLHKNDVKPFFFSDFPTDGRQNNAAPVIVLLVGLYFSIHSILPENPFF